MSSLSLIIMHAYIEFEGEIMSRYLYTIVIECIGTIRNESVHSTEQSVFCGT